MARPGLLPLPGPGRISGYKTLCDRPEGSTWDLEHDHAADEIRRRNIDSARDSESVNSGRGS